MLSSAPFCGCDYGHLPTPPDQGPAPAHCQYAKPECKHEDHTSFGGRRAVLTYDRQRTPDKWGRGRTLRVGHVRAWTRRQCVCKARRERKACLQAEMSTLTQSRSSVVTDDTVCTANLNETADTCMQKPCNSTAVGQRLAPALVCLS